MPPSSPVAAPAWNGNRASWPYRVGRILVRAGVRLFYRRVLVHTPDHVPPRGPAIFAATHPNSITDALVLGACVPRPLHYVAHSGLFRRPVLRWLLPRCGVIPVYRPEDFPGPIDNTRMFGACIEALRSGGAIGIFPEGTSHRDERVRRLRTGTARLALEAEAQSDFGLGVQLVPVGLNFQAPGRFRSDVVVLIGSPLQVQTFRAAHRADPVQAAQALTAELQSRLADLALELPEPDFLPLVRRTLRLLRSAGGGTADRLLSEHAEARAVGRALAWAARERPLEYADYARRLESHSRRRRRLGLTDATLAQANPTPRRPGTLALASLPVALAGAAAHAVPYRLTGWLTRRLRPDPTKEATVKFCAGAVLFSLWYALLGTIAWLLWGPRASVLYVTAMTVAGLVALGWLHAWQAAWGGLRLVASGLSGPAKVERLRVERGRLAAEARRLWEAFRSEQAAW
jgi:1-acyl-sn-glycerol-3-phosphate acyltransferase